MDPGEECDDGNTEGGDGCSAVCLYEECGNEYVDIDEECDDGNFEEADGCSPTCMLEYCGDGIIGIILSLEDGFESGSFNLLPWTEGSPYSFEVTGDQVHQGSFAAGASNAGMSGTISTLTLDMYSDGDMCFWYAGQSEIGYDFFRFFIDDVQMLIMSGTHTEWTEICYSVVPGDHSFEWRYSKDGSVNIGWDAFYIDDVKLAGGWEEECDDGNSESGDGCDSLCQEEP
jgi:cysteine-rich repeat protein